MLGFGMYYVVSNIYRQSVSRYIYYRQSKAYRRIETGSHFFYILVSLNSFQTVEPQLPDLDMLVICIVVCVVMAIAMIVE